MKRVLAVVMAILFGLFVAWACSYLGSRIDWPVSQTPRRGCYEIDHCNVPWWIIALFLGSFFGPSVLYGATAFVGTGRCWTAARWGITFALLVLLTVCVYLGGYAYQAFI